MQKAAQIENQIFVLAGPYTVSVTSDDFAYNGENTVF